MSAMPRFRMAALSAAALPLDPNRPIGHRDGDPILVRDLLKVPEANLDLVTFEDKGAPGGRVDLVQADFRGRSIQGTTFRNADLMMANLSDADLRLSDLEDVDLTGCIVNGTRIRQDQRQVFEDFGVDVRVMEIDDGHPDEEPADVEMDPGKAAGFQPSSSSSSSAAPLPHSGSKRKEDGRNEALDREPPAKKAKRSKYSKKTFDRNMKVVLKTVRATGAPPKNETPGYSFLRTCKKLKKDNLLEPDQEVQLGKLPGFTLKVKTISARRPWDVVLEDFIAYVKDQDSADVPQRYVTPGGFKLGLWVNAQRQNWDGLSDDQQSRLLEHGFLLESGRGPGIHSERKRAKKASADGTVLWLWPRARWLPGSGPIPAGPCRHRSGGTIGPIGTPVHEAREALRSDELKQRNLMSKASIIQLVLSWRSGRRKSAVSNIPDLGFRAQ
jgi:hypothetical protein